MASPNLLATAFIPKYRSLTLGILVLLALILVLLGMNILFTSGSDADTRWANLVGIQRSRMLQVEASLESMQAARQSNRAVAPGVLERLLNGYEEIDSTLAALRNGGDVNLRDQKEKISVAPVPYADAKAKLEEVNNAWISAKSGLVDVGTKGKDASAADLSKALTELQKQSGPINTKLTEVASILSAKAAGKSNLLRLLQVVGMLLFTGYCIGCIIGFVKKLKSSDEEIIRQTEGLKVMSDKLQSSKGETDMILGSVSEGLFLLDTEMNIGTQYSAACKKLFGMDDLAGQSFIKLFRKLVPAKTFDTAKKYMNLIFKPHIEEATLAKFNPFHELEINFEDGRGGFQTKYLDFRFNRIFENKEVKLVMVTLSDVTDRVKLEQQLKESEEQTQRQLEMMLDILHCDIGQLEDFLTGAESHLNQIGALLKGDQTEVTSTPERAAEYKRILDVIFRHMHTIKGDSSMIQLRFFEAKAHGYEEKIQALRTRTTPLSGNDFLPITLALSEMFDNIREIRELVAKLGDLRGSLGFGAQAAAAPKAAPAPAPAAAAPAKAAPAPTPPPSVKVPEIKVPVTKAFAPDAKVPVPEVKAPAPEVKAPANGDKPAAPAPAAPAGAPGPVKPAPAPAPAAPAKPEAKPEPTPEAKPEPVPVPVVAAKPASTAMVNMIDQLATNLGTKQGKDLAFQAADFNEDILPEQVRRPIRDVIVQLVRNSVTHGLEGPDERAAARKSPQGQIQMSVQKPDDKIIVTLRDDGRGLLPEKLTKRALEMGRWSMEDIDEWDANRLNGLIFITGFSTADEITTDAGRGIGMDIVRETIEELGGTITVDSVPGQYCQFQLVLPS